MSETVCAKCEGKRAFCSRCGKPRRRRRPGFDVGVRVCCPGARVRPCVGHTEPQFTCDVCLKPNGPVRLRHWIASLYACERCHKAWDEWAATMRDRFIEARQAGESP